jgi:hypothetical protein
LAQLKLAPHGVVVHEPAVNAVVRSVHDVPPGQSTPRQPPSAAFEDVAVHAVPAAQGFTPQPPAPGVWVTEAQE